MTSHPLRLAEILDDERHLAGGEEDKLNVAGWQDVAGQFETLCVDGCLFLASKVKSSCAHARDL